MDILSVCHFYSSPLENISPQRYPWFHWVFFFSFLQHYPISILFSFRLCLGREERPKGGLFGIEAETPWLIAYPFLHHHLTPHPRHPLPPWKIQAFHYCLLSRYAGWSGSNCKEIHWALHSVQLRTLLHLLNMKWSHLLHLPHRLQITLLSCLLPTFPLLHHHLHCKCVKLAHNRYI
jgi:hypothetical protein